MFGPPKATSGLIPFLESILQEQVSLGDSEDSIRITKERIQTANNVLHRKER
jgi:hypothetical protein